MEKTVLDDSTNMQENEKELYEVAKLLVDNIDQYTSDELKAIKEDINKAIAYLTTTERTKDKVKTQIYGIQLLSKVINIVLTTLNAKELQESRMPINPFRKDITTKAEVFGEGKDELELLKQTFDSGNKQFDQVIDFYKREFENLGRVLQQEEGDSSDFSSGEDDVADDGARKIGGRLSEYISSNMQQIKWVDENTGIYSMHDSGTNETTYWKILPNGDSEPYELPSPPS
jgi:hypothetical protein